MVPLGVTAYRLAEGIGVPVTRLPEIVAERRRFRGDTALRLARDFRTTPEFWTTIPRDHERETTADILGDRLERAVHPRAA